MQDQDPSTAVNKIQSDELRRLTAEDIDEQEVSVIIQLDLPQRRVVVDRVNRDGVTINVPVRVERETPEEQEEAEKRVVETRTFLEDLLGTSPLWLRSARSFGARATPEQLRIIAQNPAVKAIWPNRNLQPSFSTVE